MTRRELGTFGPYRLLQRIGEGGFADVFLANREGRPPEGRTEPETVVVKRLHSHLCDQADMVDMFVTEAKVLQQLDHPAVVRLYGLERQNNRWAMVMERVRGTDLAQIFDHALTVGVPLPLSGAVRMIIDVAEALHHAHERMEHEGAQSLGIVHRDVKPDNVLVDAHGNVKLIDFGCAKASLQSHLTRPGIRKGTLDYMSPEQCLGRAVDRRTDIFSLGVVLYELATMTRLYADASDARVMERIVHEVARPPSWHDDRVNASLDLVVLRALEKRPEDRFGTMAEFSRALNWWLDRYADTTDPRAELAQWLNKRWFQLRRLGDEREQTGVDAQSPADARGGPVEGAPSSWALPTRPNSFPSVAPMAPAQLRPNARARNSGGLVLGAGSAVRSGDEDVPLQTETASGVHRTSDPVGVGDTIAEARVAALQGLVDRRTNLSPSRMPAWGQAADATRVEALFAAGEQIVVILGSPGVGKTTLADSVLHALLVSGRHMQGGVWWVNADGVVTHSDLAQRLGRTLGVQTLAGADDAVAVLAHTLTALGPTRLAVDAADSLDDSAFQALATWISSAPELEILVTRREACDFPGLVDYTLEPLPVPRRADDLARSDVGCILAFGVSQHVPGFAIDASLAGPTLALLRRLGGHPGAILNAASQISADDPLDSVQRLLAAIPTAPKEPRTLDEATLAAALDWSWLQADEEERRILAGASLFHGGFDLEAAAAVLGWMRQSAGSAATTQEMLTLLERLRERNLIGGYEPAEFPGTLRFTVTRGARTFARDRLLERPDCDSARRGHANHYLDRADRLLRELDSDQGRLALCQLRLEQGNFSAILQRALRVDPPTRSSAARAVRASLALWPLADRSGRAGNWADMVAIAMDHCDRVGGSNDLGALVEMLCKLSVASLRRREQQVLTANRALDRARTIAPKGDERCLGLIAAASGEHLVLRGEVSRAGEFLRIAVASLPSSSLRVNARLTLARVERSASKLEAAAALIEEALAEAQELGAQHAVGQALAQRGALRFDLEQLPLAVADLRRALAEFEAQADDARAARCQLELARAAEAGGDAAAARDWTTRAATLLRQIGREDLVVPPGGALPAAVGSLL